MAKIKPMAGHKRDSVSFGVGVTCECGWRSNTYFGKGAAAEAHGEWHMHVDAHRRAATPSDTHEVG